MEKKKGSILVVDDNIQILNALDLLLRPEFQSVTLIQDPQKIPAIIADKHIDLVLLDMNFSSGTNSGAEGLHWLAEILKMDACMMVIMITAYGDIDLAVKAVKLGAIDFIAKPWNADKLILTIDNTLKLRFSSDEVNKLRTKQIQINEDIDNHHRMFRSTSKIMNDVYRTIDKVAKTDANVIILGENGTGKEVIAHEIHRKSDRCNEIFLAVDMGSISDSLFESEMFGHLKGAFTDAKENRAGRFETASGGTLFMDEISNLSMPSQAKLLGVLQNRQITRIGSSTPIQVDFRLITATNKNPEKLVHLNLFREDLLFRLNTIQIELPPLRERKEDIPGLADYFLKQYSTKYEKKGLMMNNACYDALINHSWSGNIRELKHTIEKAVILSDSGTISPSDFSLKGIRVLGDHDNLDEKLADIEKTAIIKVLEKCRGNIAQAARILDISRTTLYSKMKDYRI